MAKSRLADIYGSELKSGRGAFSGLGTAIGKRALEKIDIRNALFGGSGIGSQMGRAIFGKGYSATPRSGTSRTRQNLSSNISIDTSSIVQRLDTLNDKADDINTNLKIIAKSSITLPSINHDTNVIRSNVGKIVTLLGGQATRKTDMFFKTAEGREADYESKFQKEKPTKVETTQKTESKDKEKSLFESILSPIFTGIQGILSTILDGSMGIIGLLLGTKFAKSLMEKFGIKLESLIPSSKPTTVPEAPTPSKPTVPGGPAPSKPTVPGGPATTAGRVATMAGRVATATGVGLVLTGAALAAWQISQDARAKGDKKKELEELMKIPEDQRNDDVKARIKQLNEENVFRTSKEGTKSALESYRKRFGPEPTEPAAPAPAPTPTPAPTPAKFAETKAGGVTGQIKSTQQNLSMIEESLKKQGITDPNYIAAVKANVMKETGGKTVSENLNYGKTSNERIKSIFGSRASKFSDEELNKIKSDPQKMAEMMYGKETAIGKSMGNTEEGDGFKYRGRGFIQLTGKKNYAAASKAIFGDDRLVKDPDMANNPETAAAISAWYMKEGQSRMAANLKIDTANMSRSDANILATSQIAGGDIRKKGEYGKELLSKVTAFSEQLGKGSPSSIASAPTTGSSIAATSSQVATGQRTEMAAAATPSAPSTTTVATQQQRPQQSSKDQLLTADKARNTSFMDYLQAAYIAT